MDFGKLFFSAYGRIGRQEFWVGWIILWMIGLFALMIPVLNIIAWAGLVYCGVCIRSKRLHDMGRTGWLQIIPVIASIVFIAVLIWGAVGSLIAGGIFGPVAAPAIATSVVLVALTGVASWLIDIGFLLWIGISERDPYDNIYGPGPSDDYMRQTAAV